MSENFIGRTKSFIVGKKEAFKGLKKGHKIAIGIACGTVIVATVFGVMYGIQNKYDILFYDLNTDDSASIVKQLEDKGVDVQIKAGNIYVPKAEVDRLRLELAPEVENGSKGFELMDEGSSLGMTDDEFALKKKRMLSGEIEKTIKTFPQVEDVKVNITDGVKSVFSSEVKPGTSAVSVLVKEGYSLSESQVRSIVSLVSASCENVPKENVEVVDQELNLLSDGLFDEKGDAIAKNNEKLDYERKAEKDLDNDLSEKLLNVLEPIFGKGKVKIAVNSDLLFDEETVNKLVVDPNKVITHEERTEDISKEGATTGSPTDNNMNNVGEDGENEDTSKSELIDYAVGKEETNIVKGTGVINKLSATVVIDGVLPNNILKEVEDMVSSALTIDVDRGDFIKVSAMEFAKVENTDFEAMEKAKKEKQLKTLALAGSAGTILLISGITYAMIRAKKKREELEEEENYLFEKVLEEKPLDNMEELMATKIKEDEKHRESQFGISDASKNLEKDAKDYAKENIDDVIEVIKLWLSE